MPTKGELQVSGSLGVQERCMRALVNVSTRPRLQRKKGKESEAGVEKISGGLLLTSSVGASATGTMAALQHGNGVTDRGGGRNNVKNSDSDCLWPTDEKRLQ